MEKSNYKVRNVLFIICIFICLDTYFVYAQQVGLGVSRNDFIAVFGSKEIGFNFETSTEVDGQPRSMGTSENGLCYLELIGPPRNLIHVTIMAGLPSDSQYIILQNTIFCLGFLNVLFPNWEQRSDWFSESVDRVVSLKKVEKIYDKKLIKLEFIQGLGMLLLSVKPL